MGGKVRPEIISTLGRLDVLEGNGALDRLIASLARHSERQWVEAEALPLVGEQSQEYGVALVFSWLWRHLGLHPVFRDSYRESAVEFPVEEAVSGMVLNRPDFAGVELHYLYGDLDFVAERIKRMEEAPFLKEAGLFGLEVDLVFFDITSTYFEGRGPRGLAGLGYGRDKRPDLNTRHPQLSRGSVCLLVSTGL